MKVVKVNIEKGNNEYFGTAEVLGVVTDVAKTIQDLKKGFPKVFKSHIESCIEFGDKNAKEYKNVKFEFIEIK